ncbi:unnamed protein product [Nyctereutes procyonoides]|uniref:(raccoon dog) hypothetical protein n=1 Tax=Nyctereutes procyonoides TaxID=34880 RepID=A0A811ZP95_NYCPR|nr:unnamed protein product [Nyctereutes procyonoides]
MAQIVCNLAEKALELVNAALLPPTPAEIPTATQSLKKIVKSAPTCNFKPLTVKEALLNGLVATEVWMRFDVGEIIVRHGIIGYNV